jgi:two-component system cell cycle sensor histidine kinase/response regulator CckA
MALNKIPSAVSGYLVAALSFGAALAITYAIPAPKLPGYAYGFLYIIAVFIAAWKGGFVAGVLASLGTLILVPYLFVAGFTLTKVEIGRSVLLIACSLLISAMAQNRRRTEAALHQVNEQLEARVAQRTGELSAAFESLRTAMQERMAVEQSLSESDERLSNVLESITDGFIAVDRNWRCTHINRKAAELLRKEGREPVGEVIRNDLPAALGPRNEADLNRAMEERVQVHFESYAEPLQRWFETDVFPTREGLALFARDITERKRFNEQLRQTQKLESLGVLAGGVAHDFNNLLVGILGNSSLAADALPRGNPARAMLEEVVTAAERAADLTRQLLAYSGKGRFVIELLDLSSLVEEITMLVQASIARTVQLRLDLTKGLPPIEADAGQMQQLLMNLVINGAEAIGDRPGTVTVATGLIEVDEPYLRGMLLHAEISPGPYVFAEVQDTGVGMDQQTVAKIFDPFFTTKFTGRGLGLAAALGIVRGHKGAIKVYSTPGRGTTFKLLFPAAIGKTVTRENGTVNQELLGEARVLVVDDEQIVRRAAKMTLERYGYSVVLAENGERALEILRESPLAFDVVLLDLNMPVLSGEDTLREMRKIRPNLPVILSSGFNEVEAIRRFQGKGLSGFVQKPYTAATLAHSVKAALTKQ